MPQTRPLALQLYTLRDDLARDLAGVLQTVAEIGYAGVEPFGLTTASTRLYTHLLNDFELRVPSLHGALPLDDETARMVDIMHELGCTRLVVSTPRERFTSADAVKRVCDEFNAASANAAANGLTLGLHNHWWEFADLDGQNAFDLLLEHLDPAIFFEIDTYWVQVSGYDPAAVIQKLGERAPLLHIKDGPADVPESDMTAVGAGVLDFPAIMAAGAAAEWLIVELDRCATDMTEAVAASYTYLVDNGLGHGAEGMSHDD